MRKKFAFNLLFLVFVNLLVKPFWILGIDRGVQNAVGAAAYGTYFAVFNYSFLFSIVLDFGINNFNNRSISRSPNRLASYFPNLMVIKILLAAAYFLITLFTALFTGFSALQIQLLFILAINQILLSFILYIRSNLGALHLFKIDSIVSVLDRLLTILFCGILLWHPLFRGQFHLEWYVYSQTIALALTVLVGFIIVKRKSNLNLELWKWRFTKRILLKSFPFALLGLLMTIYYRIDAIMIERMLPDGDLQAGIYAASYRLLDAVNMFGYLFATILLPLFGRMLSRKENVNELVQFSSGLMLVFSFSVGWLCYLFQNEIMHLLYKDADAYWGHIFGWLMLSFIPISTVYIYGTLLTAKGSMKKLNILAGCGIVVNVLLNLWLIPTQKAFGATIATFITQLFVAGVHILIAKKELQLTGSKKEVLKPVAYIALSLLTGFLFYKTADSWMLNILLCGGIMALLSFVLGLVPLKHVTALFKK